MPFILDKKYDPLYKDGWNEAWSEAWSEAEQTSKLNDAVMIIKRFNLPIDEVVKTLSVDKNKLLQKLKDNK